MKVKIMTSIYSDLYGSDMGGRPGRKDHYRFSLLSLLKMTQADFVCYTSERELESLNEFFYKQHQISQEKLKFEVFDISNTKFKDLINYKELYPVIVILLPKLNDLISEILISEFNKNITNIESTVTINGDILIMNNKDISYFNSKTHF